MYLNLPLPDGNGRTGRYLICSLVRKNLDRFSSITFSYIINRHKDEYYKAFEQVSHPFNAGEMTFFCEQMIKFLIEGQQRILKDMNEKDTKLNIMLTNIKKLELEHTDLTETDSHILFIITQSWLFSRKYNRITNNDLINMESFGKRRRVMNATKKMEEKGFLVKISSRPIRYTLNKRFASELLNEI